MGSRGRSRTGGVVRGWASPSSRSTLASSSRGEWGVDDASSGPWLREGVVCVVAPGERLRRHVQAGVTAFCGRRGR